MKSEQRHSRCHAFTLAYAVAKPIIRARWRRILTASLCLGLAPAYAESLDTPFAPAPLFQEVQRTWVDSTPMVLRLSDDKLFVLGSTETSRGQISILGAADLKLRKVRNLPVIPVDMVVDKNGQVFVLGVNASGQHQVLAMNSSLQDLGTFDAGQALVAPILSLPGGHNLIVGSMKHPMLVIDTLTPDKLRVSATFKPPSFSIGVGQTWISTDWETLFLNLSVELSLVAYDIASVRQLGNIGYTLKGTEIEPYETVGVTGSFPCHSTTGASFLIYDPRRESLTLADFDPVFRSLDIQTTVDTPLGAGRAGFRDLIPGMGIMKPSGLLASTCDQSAIFLGSKRSKRLVQYAVNKEYRSIETTGFINTTFSSTSLVMQPQGQYAFLASEDLKLIVRYEPPSTSDDIQLRGDPAVRDLQRLLTENGYPLGSVDGLMGPLTRKALELYEQNTGHKLDLENLSAELEKSRAY